MARRLLTNAQWHHAASFLPLERGGRLPDLAAQLPGGATQNPLGGLQRHRGSLRADQAADQRSAAYPSGDYENGHLGQVRDAASPAANA